MTAIRKTASVSGTVTNGAVLWNGSAWVNALVAAVNLDSSLARVLSGSGSPEAAVTAPVGTLYTRTNGGANTTLYVKESGAGNTGWVAK